MNLFDDEPTAKWMRGMPPSFREWLEQESNDYVAKLINASDLLTVGRHQGRLTLLALLGELRKAS